IAGDRAFAILAAGSAVRCRGANVATAAAVLAVVGQMDASALARRVTVFAGQLADRAAAQRGAMRGSRTHLAAVATVCRIARDIEAGAAARLAAVGAIRAALARV